MSLLPTNKGARPAVPGLDRPAVTKEGCRYDPSLDVWRLHDGGTDAVFDFGRYRLCCTDRFVRNLKRCLVDQLRKQALDSCQNFFQRLLMLARHVSGSDGGALVDTITAADVLSFRAVLDRQNEYLLHGIRKRLLVWVPLGLDGVEADVPEFLAQMKLKGNEFGVAVRNHDPVRGAFNDEEFQALVQYLLDNYAAGVIELSDLALGFLFLAFGPRPISFSALRVKDFQVEKDKKGIPRYRLRIPAAKRQRGGRRTHFNSHPLTGEYGHMLIALVASVKLRFAGEIAAGFDPGELPLFPGEDPATGFATTSSTLYRKLVACFQAGAPIICTREGLQGTPLKVFPKRFRITVGTRMAEEGKREREIAKALGQLCPESARIYIESLGKMRARINGKLAPEITPVAQYFLGKLVGLEAEAVRGDDPTSRVRSFNGALKGEVLGTCGKAGFCGGFVPLPCYRCRSFQPWADAPHEEVLAWLLRDRQAKLEITGDPRYASVNDEVIKRISDVVRSCRLRREGAQKVIPQ